MPAFPAARLLRRLRRKELIHVFSHRSHCDIFLGNDQDLRVAHINCRSIHIDLGCYESAPTQTPQNSPQSMRVWPGLRLIGAGGKIPKGVFVAVAEVEPDGVRLDNGMRLKNQEGDQGDGRQRLRSKTENETRTIPKAAGTAGHKTAQNIQVSYLYHKQCVSRVAWQTERGDCDRSTPSLSLQEMYRSKERQHGAAMVPRVGSNPIIVAAACHPHEVAKKIKGTNQASPDIFCPNGLAHQIRTSAMNKEAAKVKGH